jgi:hypothetical protein
MQFREKLVLFYYAWIVGFSFISEQNVICMQFLLGIEFRVLTPYFFPIRTGLVKIVK